MNDVLGLVFGLLICTVPPAALVALIVWLVRSGKQGREESRWGDFEAEIFRLRSENATLVHRVSRLEQGLAALERLAASAQAATSVPHAPPIAAPIETAPIEALPIEALPIEAPIEAAPAEAPPIAARENVILVPPSAEAAFDDARPTDPAPTPTPELAGPAPAPEPFAPAPPVMPPPYLVPPPPPAPGIAWERWIGVRGAAALGASILVLAGIYFFEYSIEHGLITPAMRMIAGTLVGLGCVVASELRLRRMHSVLANWIAGAGIAILYVAFWAGCTLYNLYPNWAAGLLMIAVTGTCVTLAVRRDSPAIAILGLLGGFITPLALSTGTDRPIPLFGYILLLDGAMLWVAYKRRWAWMALLCLVATALYQNSWLIARLDEPRLVLGVAIVAVFAVLFAALPRVPGEAQADESVLWKLARSAGVLLPILFTVPLAVRQDLGDTFWPTAVQLVLLCGAASWVGLRHRSYALPSGAALLAASAMLGWGISHEADTAIEVWQLCGLGLALALVFHLFAEIDHRASGGEERPAGVPALLMVLALLTMAALGAPFAKVAGLWPWLALFAGLTALGLRVGSFPGRAVLQPAVTALSALGLGLMYASGVGEEQMPSAALFLGILVVSAAAVQLAGVLPRATEARRFGDHAAALFALALVPLASMAIDERAVPVWAFYGSTIALTVLGMLAAARVAVSGWLPVALLGSTLAHGLWVLRRESGPFTVLELAALGAAVLVVSLWPIVAPRSTREQPWAWRTAAMAGPLYLLALRHVYLDVLGPGTIGLLPLALAAVSIGAATAVRVRGPEAAEGRRVALVWLTATAAGFVTLAIPLQLAQEWITLGWALEALALTFLWRRFDHTGLKYLAFALAAVVCVRLVANPYVLGYYARSGVRIFNWLSYTYLVPAGSLLGMWALLRGSEIERRREWERPFFPDKHALLANLAASAAIIILFVWVNLTIVDFFASGPELSIPSERLPARDLSISISWAIFALSLLGFGLWRKSTALRVTSLALVLVTSAKVFLYDLAHLSDLYRVASLVGLALSLIVISLVYQRLVFRPSAPEPPR